MVEAVILELAPNEDDEFIVEVEPEKLIVGAEAMGSLNSAVIETIVEPETKLSASLSVIEIIVGAKVSGKVNSELGATLL